MEPSLPLTGSSRLSLPRTALTQYTAYRLPRQRGRATAEFLGGKSTLLEALEKIFDCAPKPEEGSTFPLASAAAFELILWQDYEHDEGTVRFSDLLSFFMGEGVGMRQPGALNIKIKNKAPCFYSGRARMHLLPSRRHTAEAARKYSGMTDERFEIFQFWNPIPKQQRDMAFPPCGRCAAKFYLTGAAQSSPGTASAGTMHVTSQGPSLLVAELEKLAHLHSTGLLDAPEFKAAKQKLLQQ